MKKRPLPTGVSLEELIAEQAVLFHLAAARRGAELAKKLRAAQDAFSNEGP